MVLRAQLEKRCPLRIFWRAQIRSIYIDIRNLKVKFGEWLFETALEQVHRGEAVGLFSSTETSPDGEGQGSDI